MVNVPCVLIGCEGGFLISFVELIKKSEGLIAINNIKEKEIGISFFLIYFSFILSLFGF